MIFTVTLNPAVDRELTVDAMEMDTVLRAAAFRVDPGGKGFNVSRALRVLGADSVALAFAGGHAGRQLRDGLEDAGIATRFVWVTGETRTNVSIVSRAEARYLKVNEPGPTVTEADVEALLNEVRTLASPGDWWVLAGSLPPGAPAGIYATLIEIIQGAGAHAALDSSGAALTAGCAARPELVKPNDVELEQISGRQLATADDLTAAARALPARRVVVSRGAAGALWIEKNAAWQAHPPSIVERNPIGAGDAMVAGMVWQLARGGDGASALRWGVAAGAAAAAAPGTSFGDRDRIAALVEQVTVESRIPDKEQ